MANLSMKTFGAVAQLLQRLLIQPAGDQDEGTAPALLLAIECEACGEVLHARIEKAEELQAEYDDQDRISGYLLSKELVGARCRNLVHVEMRFDERQRPRKATVTGGRLVHTECCG